MMTIKIELSEQIDRMGDTIALDVTGWAADGVTESTQRIAQKLGRAAVEACAAVIENCCVGRAE